MHRRLPQEGPDVEIRLTVPERMVGYAIGTKGKTKNKAMWKTNTNIKTKRDENGKTYFIIKGTRKNQYSAKLFIKKTVNTGIYRNRGLENLRFPVIDSNIGEFELKRVEKKDHRQTKNQLFELVLRNSSGAMVGNTDYSFLSDQISKILQQNKETNRASKIWCRFGHIYLTDIKQEEEGNAYTPEDLRRHLMPKRFCPPDMQGVTKWQSKFFGYIQTQDEETFFSQLERRLSSQSETSPCLVFHRYEFTYLTPSCLKIRIKVFVQVKQHPSDPSKLVFENAPSPLDVKNVLKHSDTYPFFYVCESTAKRAIVDIIEPLGPDIRLISEANLTSVPEDDELPEEVEILFKYVRENLVITQDGKVDLLQHNVPEEFDLHFSRISKQKIYTVTSHDNEKFDVILRYESPRDIKKGDYNDTKNSIDINLFYHEWESKFKSNKWDPQEIVNKIPRFIAFARSLVARRALMVDNTSDETVPTLPPRDLGDESGNRKPPYSSTSELQDVIIDVEGGFYNLSSFGVLLKILPNTVAHDTVMECGKFSPDLDCPPTEENETLVSYCVRFHSSSVKQLQKPMIVTLAHSGPSKKEGYEAIVKAWKENQWKQIQEIQEDISLAREHFKSGYIEVEISEWTCLAVVTRLITGTFEVTDKGCVVTSSVCDDVTVEFPEGAVDKTYIGSMKLLLMPDHIDILDGIAAYPCPMLLIEGFEGVVFDIPVKIKLPYPHLARCPTGNVRLFTMDTPHEWRDVTDEVHCVENESFIELQVSHFSGLWVWIYYIPFTVASSLCRYLFKVPQDVCFAVFKENDENNDISLTMTLVCVPNHEQFDKIAEMRKEGYTKLASSTGNKKMRPDDKAYIKVEGCYKKMSKEDIFLQFLKNDICKKELPLRRKTNKKGKRAANSSRELNIFLLKKKDDDVKDNLCKFCIYETQIVPKVSEKKHSSEVPKVGTVGLQSAPPGPSGLCGSESGNRHGSSSTNSAVSEAASCKALEVCFGDKSIATIDANEAATKVADFLQLDKISLADPPDDIKVKCRELCSYLKTKERGDIVEKIRVELPSGMTGPRADGSLLVRDMDFNFKQALSQALSGKDEWKAFAESIGLSSREITYYDNRVENPVLKILGKYCEDMTVDELYVHIVKSGANAIADDYL